MTNTICTQCDSFKNVKLTMSAKLRQQSVFSMHAFSQYSYVTVVFKKNNNNNNKTLILGALVRLDC